jgi:hypothetical protein
MRTDEHSGSSGHFAVPTSYYTTAQSTYTIEREGWRAWEIYNESAARQTAVAAQNLRTAR